MAEKTKHAVKRIPKQTNHPDNFLGGAAGVLRIAPRREYHTPKRGGFARDRQMLREDFGKIAGDLNYAVHRHGEG